MTIFPPVFSIAYALKCFVLNLRGIFLKKLRRRYDSAASDEEKKQIEQAARWGLAALNNAEEVVQHEDP